MASWGSRSGSAFASTADPEPGREKEGEAEGEQTLPVLIDGQHAMLTQPRVQAKQTQPPPRYNEGTLVDAMQNAWRFVKDEALRERLKEAKGIGTPATRAEIIKGLKRQNMLAADGKLVVPTPAGLQLFELLRAAAPALVDPGTTAIWEMRLDDVVVGKANFRAVIDEIASEADRLITVLRQHNGGTVDLSPPATVRTRRRRSPARGKSHTRGHATAATEETRPKTRRRRKAKDASHQVIGAAQAERRHRAQAAAIRPGFASDQQNGRVRAAACQGQEGRTATRLRQGFRHLPPLPRSDHRSLMRSAPVSNVERMTHYGLYSPQRTHKFPGLPSRRRPVVRRPQL